jgi:ADP-L-glycero-D-manno-heptose 6-epimerase
MTLHLTQRDAYGIYNVGSGEAHTWLDLVRPIFRAMNAPERIDFVEMPAALREKYQYHTRASLARLRSTGYDRAVTPLADAVDDYVRNYLVPDRRLDPSQALAAAAVK